MSDRIRMTIDGREIAVEPGTTVAAALMMNGVHSFRESPNGDERGPLCGMGICFECRMTVNGASGVRTCNLLCADGMEVSTQ